jgi:hypothetical protein
MTCEECEQILLDSSSSLGGRGWMPGVKSHAQNCPTCATKMSEIGRMQDALDKLRVFTKGVEAPAAVEANLLAAFREQCRVPGPSFGKVFAWRLMWGSAAALLLIAAGVMLYSDLRPRFPRTVQTERNQGEQPAQRQLSRPVAGTAGLAVVQSHQPGTDNAVSATYRSDTLNPDKPTHERIGRRPPIAVGDELSLNGGGSIVRVTLPLSSLVAMGVPVHPDTLDPRVTADVMIDPFGAVVGIRLVEAKRRVN